jgi:hypothetical protein
MSYKHTVLKGCKKPHLVQPVMQFVGWSTRRHDLPAIALFLFFVSGALEPALAQPQPVCGSPCSAWAAITSSAAAPASASIAGEPTAWLAWKGHSSNYIYFSNGYPYTAAASWTSQAKVSGVSASGSTWYAETNVSPALTWYGEDYGPELVLAWKGVSDTSIWYSIYSSGAWTQQTSVSDSNVQTNQPPALTTDGFGTVYLAWTTPGDEIEYMTFSGGNWSNAPVIVPGASTTLAPAMTYYNGSLYVAWTNTAGYVQYISYNSSSETWSAVNTATVDGVPATSAVAPALAAPPFGPDVPPHIPAPFAAWTAPSGEIYYSLGSLLEGISANNGIASYETPALAFTSTYSACYTTWELYLAFTNGATDGIYTNFLNSWTSKNTCTL